MSHNSIDAIVWEVSQKLNSIFYDREFVGSVKEDIEIVLKSNNNNICVLFPRLKPIFLKALYCEAELFGLKVFYIGEGRDRIAVVCKKLFVQETNGSNSKSVQRITEFKVMEEEETATRKKGNKNVRPTQSFYVPPARRLSTKRKPASPKSMDPKCSINDKIHTETSNTPIEQDKLEDTPAINLACATEIENNVLSELGDNILEDKEIETQVDKDEPLEGIDIISEHLKNTSLTTEKESITEDKNNANLYISITPEQQQHTYKDDSDHENKIQKTLENINRRSKPLIKHIPTDDTLRIEANEKLYIDEEQETNLSNWEDMFDENGDLQKEYVGEITKQIGCDVEILKATNDYSSYQNTVFQDLEHVIELYDFPATFKTRDLIQLYSAAYQDVAYVKWCDETHALLVLSTPAQAQRALKIEHDIIKSRPLTEASKAAAVVASCTDLKPAMKRPPTNMQTARRLINTHLGTKIKLSKEVLEEERKVLHSAREKKRQERQNERDAWEGNPRSSKDND